MKLALQIVCSGNLLLMFLLRSTIMDLFPLSGGEIVVLSIVTIAFVGANRWSVVSMLSRFKQGKNGWAQVQQ